MHGVPDVVVVGKVPDVESGHDDRHGDGIRRVIPVPIPLGVYAVGRWRIIALGRCAGGGLWGLMMREVLSTFDRE
jgi:hypothetical protein